MKRLAALLLMVGVLIPAATFGDYADDKKKYDACVAKVRKDYPVPPGNVNAQKQMIKQECGDPPKPPKE